MRYRNLRFPDGKTKAFTLSYDDGRKDDIKFSDIITGYGLKCTFNLNCEGLQENELSESEIRKYILSRGHEIAVHGAKHRAEGLLRNIEGISDVLDCRRELERKFDTIIRGMAYPDYGITRFSNNASYDKIKQYLNDLDIVYARTLGGDNNSFFLPEDWYAWMPTAHHENPMIMQYIDEFVDLYPPEGSKYLQLPRLFYIWGHSFEFEKNNNWELLDAICKKISHKEDVWYATNMEIYEYVQAYNSLVYSAAGNIVYNPTLYDIWFDIDEKLYCIGSGKYLSF